MLQKSRRGREQCLLCIICRLGLQPGVKLRLQPGIERWQPSRGVAWLRSVGEGHPGVCNPGG